MLTREEERTEWEALVKLLKRAVCSLFSRLGLEISLRKKNEAFKELYPQCWHGAGFVYNIFGHLLYQNVTDLINYSGLMDIDLNDYAQMHTDEMAVIIKNVKPGQRVIDIGANIGLYTLLLAKLVGADGRVIAFEPGPVSFGLLTVNTHLNRYRNVTLENRAVTDISRTEYYFTNQAEERTNESGGVVFSSKPNFDHSREMIPVEAVSLDDYFAGRDCNVDYIKMDVEGGEYAALKGMKNLLNANPSIILTIEFAPYLPLWADIDIQEFLDYIRSYGFEIFDLRKDDRDPVSDEYLMESYPKQSVGKYANLLLKRS